jgi:peroxiredoxin
MMNAFKLFLVILPALFWNYRVSSQTTHPEPKTLEIGSRAPDFNLPGVDGKIYTLKDFNNKLLVIHFQL